jgi:hypothetical protein
LKVGSGANNCSSTVVSTVAVYKQCSESTEDDGCELHVGNENTLMSCRIVGALENEDNLEDIIVGFILVRCLKVFENDDVHDDQTFPVLLKNADADLCCSYVNASSVNWNVDTDTDE